MTPPSWLHAFEVHAQRLLAQHQIPGMAVAIAKDGHLLYESGFGYRNVARALPVTPDTLFGVASVTKSFAALAIMQLADAGKLSVDDPVVKWLPEFRVPDRVANEQITIHHFLTHTSGLPGLSAVYHARAGSIRRDPDAQRLGVPYDPFQVEPIQTYEELMDLIARADFRLLGKPGAYFNYSNEGYALLQGIIERASGAPILRYLQERILEPIGMSHSTFLTSDLTRFPRVTELYSSSQESGRKVVFHSPTWWDVGAIYTNGSLKSTVQDLVKYLQIYRTGGVAGSQRIVSEQAIRQMTTPHVILPTGRAYGYGLDIQQNYHGVTLVGHGGGIKGVSSHIMIAPEQGFSVAVLTNLAGVPAEEVAIGAVNAWLGLPPGAPRREYPAFAASLQTLAECEGNYRSDEGEAAQVALVNGALQVQSAGQTLVTRPYQVDGVVTADGRMPMRFLRGGDGRIFGLFIGSRVLTRC